jgi:hypothetical protein
MVAVECPNCTDFDPTTRDEFIEAKIAYYNRNGYKMPLAITLTRKQFEAVKPMMRAVHNETEITAIDRQLDAGVVVTFGKMFGMTVTISPTADRICLS